MNQDVPRIMCIGSAVQDVFLSGNIMTAHYDDGKWEEQFRLGEKYELENIKFTTGGGATNSAVTFARQGLHAIFAGKVGKDPAGRAILDELHGEGVDTSLAKEIDYLNTGYSTFLLSPEGDRVILCYRGASQDFKKEDISVANMSVEWLYISSLAGQMEVLDYLIDQAKNQNIKVALNPGQKELDQADWLRNILSKVDMLTLNKEELLRIVEGETDEQLVRYASDMTPIVIMTDGPRGVVATDRQKVYKAGMYEDVPVIDRTGAGDAFGSGLVAVLARGGSLAEAIKFASANSTSVVGQIGAKAGILAKDTILHDMPLDIVDF